MANSTKCDGCGNEWKGGRWLRLRLEPFYPTTNSRGMDICEPNYSEGMTVEACGPQCAALALGREASVLAGKYEQITDAFLRVEKKLGAEVDA